MGEYAEMMLDGTCCEACGEYLGFGSGLPEYCSKACAEGRGAKWVSSPAAPIKKTKCPECGKRVKIVGLRDHLRDVHGANGKRGMTDDLLKRLTFEAVNGEIDRAFAGELGRAILQLHADLATERAARIAAEAKRDAMQTQVGDWIVRADEANVRADAAETLVENLRNVIKCIASRHTPSSPKPKETSYDR